MHLPTASATVVVLILAHNRHRRTKAQACRRQPKDSRNILFQAHQTLRRNRKGIPECNNLSRVLTMQQVCKMVVRVLLLLQVVWLEAPLAIQELRVVLQE